MNARINVKQWLNNLGQTHEALLEKGFIEKQPFIEVYPGADHLYIELLAGMDLMFTADTKILQSIVVTVIKRTSASLVIDGVLSEPFWHLTKDSVRQYWGEPIKSRGPLTLPAPLGKVGGWDLYKLDPQGFENACVVYQYTIDFQVSGVVIELVEASEVI